MKRSMIVSSLLLGGVLAAGASMLAPSLASEVRPPKTGDGQWLSIQNVLDKLEASGYRNFEEVERERGAYEIRATDRDGERIKLHVNPHTGDVVDQRTIARRAWHDGERRGHEDASRADCSERRCRDDLPRANSSPVPEAR